MLAVAVRQEGAEVELRTREVVGQARGILMVRHDLDREQADTVLRSAAEQRGLGVDVLARQVVAGATTLP